MKLLFKCLSFWPLWALQALGATIAWLLWFSHSKRRAVAMRNVAACFPDLDDAAVRQRARRALVAEMQTMAELPLIWLGSERRVRALWKDSTGYELLEAVIAQGKGCMMLTMHHGSFEGVAVPFSEHHVITGVYKPQKGALEELSSQGRTRHKGQLVPAIGGSVRKQMLECLAAGELVYMLPDQDPPEGRGIFAPFFGIPAHTPTLVPRLVQESDAPILFMYGERLPRGRGFVFHIRKPVSEDIYSHDLLTSATAMNASIEACVRECPDQYWWGYRRFRRRLPGEPLFYAD